MFRDSVRQQGKREQSRDSSIFNLADLFHFCWNSRSRGYLTSVVEEDWTAASCHPCCSHDQRKLRLARWSIGPGKGKHQSIVTCLRVPCGFARVHVHGILEGHDESLLTMHERNFNIVPDSRVPCLRAITSNCTDVLVTFFIKFNNSNSSVYCKQTVTSIWISTIQKFTL